MHFVDSVCKSAWVRGLRLPLILCLASWGPHCGLRGSHSFSSSKLWFVTICCAVDSVFCVVTICCFELCIDYSYLTLPLLWLHMDQQSSIWVAEFMARLIEAESRNKYMKLCHPLWRTDLLCVFKCGASSEGFVSRVLAVKAWHAHVLS